MDKAEENTPISDAKDSRSNYSYRTRSHTSCSSSRSQAAAVLMKQRAKAEAAKVRLHYAIQETKLIQEENNAKLRRNVLLSERDVEEAEAELRVMEVMLEEEDRLSVHSAASAHGDWS